MNGYGEINIMRRNFDKIVSKKSFMNECRIANRKFITFRFLTKIKYNIHNRVFAEKADARRTIIVNMPARYIPKPRPTS